MVIFALEKLIKTSLTTQKTKKLTGMEGKPVIKYSLFVVAIFLTLITSCVPVRKYEELLERRQICEEQNAILRSENINLATQNNELSTESARINSQMEMLRRDTTHIGASLRNLRMDYNRVRTAYEAVLEQNAALIEGKDAESAKILGRLQETQVDLQRREDELRRARIEMEANERRLNELNARIQQSANELNVKSARLGELESVLARQDSVVNALRRTVSNALLGFEGQGLSIDIRNGKVYVSLEESLLFASGSAAVDTRGVNALRELAKVLERNPEINVLIEGHTDDVPLRPGGQIRDNWDLSVLRATAIVRILLNNGNIDPKRLTAAGRGEFLPVAAGRTAEARRQNRRTEIILTPRLDELFQIIESN